jgi:nucleotide-binding universal stress UspA family protein
MTIRNILVPILPKIGAEAQLEAALQLSRCAAVHVDAVFLRPDPGLIFAAMPDMAVASGVTMDAIDEEYQLEEKRARAAFDAWRTLKGITPASADHTLATTVAEWSDESGFPEVIAVRRGRLSDIIVLNQTGTNPSASDSVFEAVVFNTGRPVIIVPSALPENLLDHVMVAWNGSLEASRAVAGAMPLLHAATQVSVFTAPQHGEDPLERHDLAEALRWHGICAQCLTPHAEDNSVGEALLRATTERGVTMLVMGAYTHSRVREMILGGVTRHVLRHAAVPVLIMH